ncbi:MAG: DUF4437 domain-containing protein [Vicinamibacteria bacterium]
MARRHIEPIVDRDVPFKKLTLPGFPRGMQYRMLSIDRDSGACSMSVQLDGGYRRPPSLSRSDVEMLVLGGTLRIGEQEHGPGYYAFVPKGIALPAMETRQGCRLLLMYNDSEPQIEESDADARPESRELLAQVNSYEGMPWQVPTLFPQTASGCLIKVLRFDERTHAMSFLYSMTPGFKQDNISYHDCAEEAYHIWGTSWIMQFGYLPSGGYFWRPPYVNHGAFASDKGCIAFGRTDGELYNHFHYHAHSTPEENQERAAARLHQRKPELYRWLITHDHNHVPRDWKP